MSDFFPGMIMNLPEADIPFEGVCGRLLQAGDYQAVFLEIEPIGNVAPHAHAAQWGVVLEGEMDLTIGNQTNTYRKGDHYYIPAGVVHSAKFRTKVRAIDFFQEPTRYQPKKPD